MEVPQHCIESVVEVRKFLTDEIAKLDADIEMAETLRGMGAVCRKFLDQSHGSRGTIHTRRFHSPWDDWLPDALGELRGIFGIHAAKLAAEYGLDIEDDLPQFCQR